MSEGTDKELLAKDLIVFKQGQDSLLNDSDGVEEGLDTGDFLVKFGNLML